MTFIDPPGVPATHQRRTHGPRFASPVNSPSYEWNDHTQFLEVTRGCSHNGCRFCTFYKNVPYSKAPLEDVEYYLDYLAMCDKKTPITRVFLQGSNAFHLSYDELMELAEMMYAHLPHLESIGGYGRMSDLRDKSVEQVRKLHETGFEHFYFGVETADDTLLEFMNKGYDAAELYEAGYKLKESGMPWVCGLMFGLGGHNYGDSHAIKSADFVNAIEPGIVTGTSLTLVYDHYTQMVPRLLKDVQSGLFEEAGEIERYEELRTFIEHLNVHTLFSNDHSTMPYRFTVKLPDQKEHVLERLDDIIKEGDEVSMARFRASVMEV
ncbi:MAG: radical SAM protein [Eggerthellaceae bacterium]|nr:radical SAM protein [Eggerthellaceae bacterium]